MSQKSSWQPMTESWQVGTTVSERYSVNESSKSCESKFIAELLVLDAVGRLRARAASETALEAPRQEDFQPNWFNR